MDHGMVLKMFNVNVTKAHVHLNVLNQSKTLDDATKKK